MFWDQIFRARIWVIGIFIYIWFILSYLGSIVFERRLLVWHQAALSKAGLYKTRKTFERMQKIRAEIIKYEGRA